MCYNSKILCYVSIRLNNLPVPIIIDTTSIGSDTGTDTSIGPPLLETLKEFELGLEKVWERECSSDSDVDEVLLMNRSCHFATGSISSCLHKGFKTRIRRTM